MILLKAATNFPITAKYCLLSGEIFLCENKGNPKQLLVLLYVDVLRGF